jgi:hypothetical protein
MALASSAPAHAQWSVGPDGTLRYNTDYHTVGTFSCNPSNLPFVSGSCSASGNVLTLRSGGSTLTTTFLGAGRAITVTNQGDQIVPVGVLQSVLSGGPFVMPMLAGLQTQPLFVLNIVLSSVNPLGLGHWERQFVRTEDFAITGNCCQAPDHFFLNTTPLPPGLGFTGPLSLVYDHLTQEVIRGETGSLTLQARVGIVPEPSTLVLLATGLVGVLAHGRGRRFRR